MHSLLIKMMSASIEIRKLKAPPFYIRRITHFTLRNSYITMMKFRDEMFN